MPETPWTGYPAHIPDPTPTTAVDPATGRLWVVEALVDAATVHLHAKVPRTPVDRSALVAAIVAFAARVAAEARLAERERLATVVARGAPVAWANRCDGDALIEASAWERELCEAFHLNEFADFAALAAPRPAGIEAAAIRLANLKIEYYDAVEDEADEAVIQQIAREWKLAEAAYRQARAGAPAGDGGQP